MIMSRSECRCSRKRRIRRKKGRAMRHYKLLGGSICSLQSMLPPFLTNDLTIASFTGRLPPNFGKLPGAIDLVGYHVAKGAP